MAYPEDELNELRNAVKGDNPEKALEIAITLAAAFLSDIRRIAEAAEHTGSCAGQAIDIYNWRFR